MNGVLIKTEKLENGNMAQTFKTDHPRITQVVIEYKATATDEDLTNFFKTIIFDYARKHKLID